MRMISVQQRGQTLVRYHCLGGDARGPEDATREVVVEDVPLVQAAVSTPLAATLRKRLVSQLQRNSTEPPIKDDAGRWLTRLEDRVEPRDFGAPVAALTANSGQIHDSQWLCSI